MGALEDQTLTTFSPIENEPPLRWQRAIGLAPRTGLGVGRRAVFFTALAWLPLVVWAALTDHLWRGAQGESLLQHFGVHARFLVAVPLLIVAEAPLHRALSEIGRRLGTSGMLDEAGRERLAGIVRDLVRLRDATMPWVLLFALVIAWVVAQGPDPRADEMAWALGEDGTFGFGGFWFAYVSRAIFLALLLAWLWRLALVVLLFARIGRLDLALVPTHPDRVGGLGFVQPLPGAFMLVTFALSTSLASRWAHDLLYHGQQLAALKGPTVAFVAVWSLLLLLPLIVLSPPLMATKRRALAEYSALVGRHGRLVEKRWIRGEALEDAALLEASEIGPVADTAAIYGAVAAMRPTPVGKRSLIPILVPIAVPMLVVAALRMPVREILRALLKAIL